MTRIQLLERFPQASESFLRENASDTIRPIPRKNPVAGRITQKNKGCVKIVITGQIRGGKNNMLVLRSGVHIPKKEWALWRDQKVKEVASQLPQSWEEIDSPSLMTLTYVAGDKRRRDMPAIIDSIFHVLEKAHVVKDDTLLWVDRSSRAYEKENPRAEILISWDR